MTITCAYRIAAQHTGHLCVNPINNEFIQNNMILEPEQKVEYVDYIKNNFGKISQREIGRRLSIGKTTVNRWAAEVNLKHQKHTVNEHYFDSLTPEKAYILGYIYADGNVSWNLEKSYWSLTITASAKDMEHLEMIRKVMQSTKPLLYSPKTKSYRFIAVSKKLCARLIELGVVPRKSLIITFPNIPDNLLLHFLRGIIDGDGTVRYLIRKRSPYFEIKIFSGSYNFLISLTHAVKKQTGIKASVRKIGKNVFEANYSCSRGEKLARLIYSHANIFLKRKYEKYTYWRKFKL